MESLKKLRRILPLKNAYSRHDDMPSIGFRLKYCEKNRKVYVHIIGAKNLPSVYGNSKAKGYFIKLILFPSRQRYETELYRDSNPSINVEFCFQLPARGFTPKQPFCGEFLSFTIYSVLQLHETRKIQSAGATHTLRNFFGLKKNVDDAERNKNPFAREAKVRNSMKNRRDVGRITHFLDIKEFSETSKGEFTIADIWKAVENMYTPLENKQDGKGTIDLKMMYIKGEDDNDDKIEIGLAKFFCSRATMQDYEKYGASIWFKISISNNNEKIVKWKSKPYDPSISILLNSPMIIAEFPNYSIKTIKAQISLESKSGVGKKVKLGTIDMDNQTQIWKQMVEHANIEVNTCVNFK